MCVVNHAWYHIWCNKSSSDLPNMLFIPSKQACTKLTVANKKSWRHNSLAPKVCCPYSKSFGIAIFYCQNTFWRHKFSSEVLQLDALPVQEHHANSTGGIAVWTGGRSILLLVFFFESNTPSVLKKHKSHFSRSQTSQLWPNLYKIKLIYIFYNTITLA